MEDTRSKRAVGPRIQLRRRKSALLMHVKEVGLEIIAERLRDSVDQEGQCSTGSRSSSSDGCDSDISVTGVDFVMSADLGDGSIFDVEMSGEEDSSELEFVSDSEEEEEADLTMNLVSFLRAWSVENNITHSALSKLLKGLQPWHKELPCDARTLLKTPRDIITRAMGEGEFFYFGLSSGIVKDMKSFHFEGNQINLRFNIDGLPLFKSNNTQFWPVLCLLDENLNQEQEALRRCFVLWLIKASR